MTTALGTGVLNWPRGERVTDRYGFVTLFNAPAAERVVLAREQIAPLVGLRGSLVATVREARQSMHIGDLFHGFQPPPGGTPEGTRIVLGTGTLTVAADSDIDVMVGLTPDDGRAHFWLDPRALYRAHEQTVELTFEAPEM